MAKATVQAALGPTTLDKVDPTNPVQVSYAETVVTMCVLSILLTAPAGAILISLSGPKLLTKTTAPVAPSEGWKARRPSIRDISIINEDPDLEETANERKPWSAPALPSNVTVFPYSLSRSKARRASDPRGISIVSFASRSLIPEYSAAELQASLTSALIRLDTGTNFSQCTRRTGSLVRTFNGQCSYLWSRALRGTWLPGVFGSADNVGEWKWYF